MTRVNWALVGLVGAAVPRLGVQFPIPSQGAQGALPPPRIEMDGTSIRFAGIGTEPRRIELGPRDETHLSPSKNLCLRFDRESLDATLYDATGRREAEFRLEFRFAAVAVADSGRMAFASPITFPERQTQVLQLFDRDGSLLWQVNEGLVWREIGLAFSPDGGILAALAPARTAVPGEAVLRAMLFDRTGETRRFDFASDARAAGVSFSGDGKIVAFGVGNLAESGPSQIALWTLGEDRPRLVPLGNLGQPLDTGFALSPDGSTLAVGGLARVLFVDVRSGVETKTIPLDPRGERGLDTVASVLAIRDRFVVAHRVNASEGRVRYAVNVLDATGTILKAETRTEPQERRGNTTALLLPSSDERSVIVQTTPVKIHIEVP